MVDNTEHPVSVRSFVPRRPRTEVPAELHRLRWFNGRFGNMADEWSYYRVTHVNGVQISEEGLLVEDSFEKIEADQPFFDVTVWTGDTMIGLVLPADTTVTFVEYSNFDH